MGEGRTVSGNPPVYYGNYFQEVTRLLPSQNISSRIFENVYLDCAQAHMLNFDRMIKDIPLEPHLKIVTSIHQPLYRLTPADVQTTR